jgi:hypothetical protein
VTQGTLLGTLCDNLAPAHRGPTWLDLKPCGQRSTNYARRLIERKAIRRGTFDSVKKLNAKIRAFIDGWNDRVHPFVWTKTADQILTKVNRQATSETGHWLDAALAAVLRVWVESRHGRPRSLSPQPLPACRGAVSGRPI